MVFIRTSIVDDTNREGGRSVWLYDLDLAGSPLELLHHFRLCSTSSRHLLCSLCNWKRLPGDNSIGFAPLPYISDFSQLTVWWKGDAIQSCLLPVSLLGHPTEAGQAV